MATHSIILASRIPWTEEPRGLQSIQALTEWTRLKQLSTHTNTHTHTHTHTSQAIVGQSFPSGSVVQGSLPMQETSVQSLGWEDPLEEGMATHSSTLASRIPWTEEPGGLQSTVSKSRTGLKRLSTLKLQVLWMGSAKQLRCLNLKCFVLFPHLTD